MEKESKTENQNNKSFNLYYLNLSKVYELSMMINNVITTNIQKEKFKSMKKTKSVNASIGGTLETDINYLASIKAAIGTNRSSEYSSSSKLIENLDIKTTKSILLNKIKEKSITNKKLEECIEGDLIKIDNVKLSILDIENLKRMLLLKRDVLKGIEVEGVDINNIISSMIKDYSYILLGEVLDDNSNNVIIKIPFEVENEFENNYNVDDILLGKVSLIGIYKNKNKLSDIALNTFNYFTNNGSDTNASNSKIIESNYKIGQDPSYESGEEYHYIDIIAVIQEVCFKEEPEIVRVPWYKRLFKNKMGDNNEK